MRKNSMKVMATQLRQPKNFKLSKCSGHCTGSVIDGWAGSREVRLK